MNKKPIIVFSILIVFGLAGVIIFSIFSPVKKDIISENKSPISFEEYIKSKSPDSLEYQPQHKQIMVSYSIPEEDLSNILWSVYTSSNSFENKAVKLQGVYTEISAENKIELHAIINILNILPSQLTTTLSPHIDGDNIVLTLEKTQLGRIQVPKIYVIDKLKSLDSSLLKIDTNKNELIIKNIFDDITKVNAIDLSSDSMKITAILPVASINDLMKLMNLDIFNNMKESLRNIYKTK